MFPLGSVLLPAMLLPLHIFEPRYQQMMADLVAADGDSFGVTLIERGHEVGGGDIRAMIGCRAQVLDCVQGPDGRWGVLAVGTERIRIGEWLPDDPYPRALVDPAPDVASGLSASETTQLGHLERRVRRCAALASELEAHRRASGAQVPLVRDSGWAIVSPTSRFFALRYLLCVTQNPTTAEPTAEPAEDAA